MVTTINPRRKRKESGGVWGSQLKDKRTEDTLQKEDKNIPEINYNDPTVQKWVAGQDERWRQKYKGFTHQDIFEFVDLRRVLREQNSKLTMKQASSMALKTMRAKKRLTNQEV